MFALVFIATIQLISEDLSQTSISPGGNPALTDFGFENRVLIPPGGNPAFMSPAQITQNAENRVSIPPGGNPAFMSPAQIAQMQKTAYLAGRGELSTGMLGNRGYVAGNVGGDQLGMVER